MRRQKGHYKQDKQHNQRNAKTRGQSCGEEVSDGRRMGMVSYTFCGALNKIECAYFKTQKEITAKVLKYKTLFL